MHLNFRETQKWHWYYSIVQVVFVSPELSSGRDLVIQMSVRRPLSAVHGFLSRAYLGNRMTYLDDIRYVGGFRSKVAHAELWTWQMPIKYLICIIYAKICPEHFSGTVCPTWMIFGMWVGLGPKVRMVTLIEVKGYQRSNGVNYCYGYHIWSKEALMQAENDDDLDWGQRSSEVKWDKLCAMATIFGQKKPWCKLRMMMEVKGHQRSNGVNYVLWLPYLVKRSADASREWWWPWWRSKVIRGQMG